MPASTLSDDSVTWGSRNKLVRSWGSGVQRCKLSACKSLHGSCSPGYAVRQLCRSFHGAHLEVFGHNDAVRPKLQGDLQTRTPGWH